MGKYQTMKNSKSLLAAVLLFVGCVQGSTVDAATVALTDKKSVTVTCAASPVPSPTVTVTATPSPYPVPGPTVTLTPAPAPTVTVTPPPVVVVSPLPVPGPTVTLTPAPGPTVTVTPAPVVVVSPYPVPGPTITVTPSCPSPVPTLSPSPSPTPSPVPSVTPSPSPTIPPASGTTQVVDSFERPEFAAPAKWVSSVTRTILDGQVTSFYLKSTAPCSLVSVPGIQKLLPLVTTKPSAPSYPLGTFYDSMKPLTSANCADAKYLQLDASASVVVGDASITVVKKLTKAPPLPSVPLNVDFNNWTMVLGYGTGAVGSDALQGLQLLKDHRISPYKGVESNNLVDWNKYVLPFQLGPVYMSVGAAAGWLSSAPVQADAWAYLIDEPAIGGDAAIATLINGYASVAPWVKPMMTAPLKQRDYRAGPNFAKLVDWAPAVKAGIKVFAPVAEQFCQDTWAGSGDKYPCAADYAAAGKDFWIYVSNMSHGNEGGAASGAPDLVIDRSAVEPFGFYLLALKYGPKALLYYNAIEGWASQDVWTNPYIYGGWGDGLLLYPDKAARKALPSARLKGIREASQWADIVKAAGMTAQAGVLMTSSVAWDHDLAKFEALRTQALNALP